MNILQEKVDKFTAENNSLTTKKLELENNVKELKNRIKNLETENGKFFNFFY